MILLHLPTGISLQNLNNGSALDIWMGWCFSTTPKKTRARWQIKMQLYSSCCWCRGVLLLNFLSSAPHVSHSAFYIYLISWIVGRRRNSKHNISDVTVFSQWFLLLKILNKFALKVQLIKETKLPEIFQKFHWLKIGSFELMQRYTTVA